MTQKLKLLGGAVLILFIALVVFFALSQPKESTNENLTATTELVANIPQIDKADDNETNTPDSNNTEPTKQVNVIPKQVMLAVPFISQAPDKDWGNPVHQDGCEEAAVLMAKLWVSGGNMSVVEAVAELKAMADWQISRFGFAVDTSAADTLTILKEYYDLEGSVVEMANTLVIKEALASRSIVLAPTNGFILNNPNFSSPPPHHMIVILGYDDDAQEFIVNDPGTRKGQNYRYSYETIEKAIQDYESGPVHKESHIRPKNIIIVKQ